MITKITDAYLRDSALTRTRKTNSPRKTSIGLRFIIRQFITFYFMQYP